MTNLEYKSCCKRIVFIHSRQVFLLFGYPYRSSFPLRKMYQGKDCKKQSSQKTDQNNSEKNSLIKICSKQCQDQYNTCEYFKKCYTFHTLSFSLKKRNC